MPNAVEPFLESPIHLDEAFRLLADAEGPAWRPIAGGTDVMAQSTGEIGEAPARLLDIWRLDELRGIASESDDLVVGALTTYTEIRHSPIVAEFLPALAECAATIGAAQIQNRGTIGGNVVNASPAGDTLPILLATGATFELGSASGRREVPADAFWVGYRRTARREDELLLRIRIPLGDDRTVRFRKVGTRRAQAISKVVTALSWRISGDRQDGAWTDVRLALGSVAPTTIRAHGTETALEGSPPTRETADAAAAALEAEISPIDDVRSTADYRRAVAGRVLHRLIRDEGQW